MSSKDFRQIGIDGEARTADKLFRAAVSAFSALKRPRRSEAAQLDDLTRPLYDATREETRRFASAALSGCQHPPPSLLKQLCREPIESAAPLLVRSPAISDIDLIALIGSHGLPHARAIARRSKLKGPIIDLLRLLGDPEIDRVLGPRQNVTHLDVSISGQTGHPEAGGGAEPVVPSSGAAEIVRQHLKRFMVQAEPEEPSASWFGPDEAEAPVLSERLFELAQRSDHGALFQALSTALGLTLRQVSGFAAGSAQWDFMIALRALHVPERTAYAVSALVSSEQSFGADAARLFFRRYSGIHPELARKRIMTWRQPPESQPPAEHRSAANTESAVAGGPDVLKAS